MIKLIASDLDGTLLHNGAQKLTPRAIELIHELTQKGVHFVAASGRQYDNERRLFSEIKDEIFLYWRKWFSSVFIRERYLSRNNCR